MSLNRLSRIIFAITTIISATFLNAAVSDLTPTPTHVSFVGQLLIAAPTIRDPHFDHAVILVVRHNQNGAMGIVINMPVEERPLANILEMLGQKGTHVSRNVRVFAGGPIEPETGFIIHSSDYRALGTIDVNEHVLLTANSQILRDIGTNKGPKKSLIAFGYAGWAPGQLEDELQRGVWFTALGDPNLIFDENRERVWDSAYSRRMQDL
jgi:putative transcriptional regulator